MQSLINIAEAQEDQKLPCICIHAISNNPSTLDHFRSLAYTFIIKDQKQVGDCMRTSLPFTTNTSATNHFFPFKQNEGTDGKTTIPINNTFNSIKLHWKEVPTDQQKKQITLTKKQMILCTNKDH